MANFESNCGRILIYDLLNVMVDPLNPKFCHGCTGWQCSQPTSTLIYQKSAHCRACLSHLISPEWYHLLRGKRGASSAFAFKSTRYPWTTIRTFTSIVKSKEPLSEMRFDVFSHRSLPGTFVEVDLWHSSSKTTLSQPGIQCASHVKTSLSLKRCSIFPTGLMSVWKSCSQGLLHTEGLFIFSRCHEGS